MGVKKGLSVDGYNYFSDVLSGKRKPDWMEFSKQIAKLSGDYRLLDMTTGLKGLESFLFKPAQWPIGGIYFDGIMRTEHMSRVRATEYPVQTGALLADHALIEPAELTIEIMMSDCHSMPFNSNNSILDGIYEALKSIQLYSNYVSLPGSVSSGEGRSVAMWGTLKHMQQSRVPLTVETRLQTYKNMIIEELSAPDDVKTLNALSATVRLREIIVANVSETKVSARVAAAQSSSTGQSPAQVGGVNKTLAEKIFESIGIDRDWLGKG